MLQSITEFSELEPFDTAITGIFKGKRCYLTEDVGAIDVAWAWQPIIFGKTQPETLWRRSTALRIINSCADEINGNNLQIEIRPEKSNTNDKFKVELNREEMKIILTHRKHKKIV